ncbi:MAG TPA: sigma-70 family RNA polymerase sigma factor [Candidatus Sulfotelmatobacter sp.]|nr:sigma-70 family RNA polymerase sigma factor [Candidatus Sulfotelmatobacter sp.]
MNPVTFLDGRTYKEAMSDTPDFELLEQFARDQSEAAFAELVERHLGLVYSMAFRKTENPQHAEDITQAVFMILARKAGSLGPKTVLPGWLYHTARLTAANFQRAEWRRIRREQEAFMQSTTNESAPDALWRELSPLLEDAMAGLGATDRDAIVLRFFQNHSLAEVGMAIGASEDAAKMRVNRALEKLRKFFYKRGVVSTTAIIAGAIAANSVQAAPAGLAQTISAVTVAKGSAASASTLMLVKGALKVMAWSKARTVAITSAAFLFTASSVSFFTFGSFHEPDYPGIEDTTWEGNFPLGGTGVNKGETTSTRIVLKLSKKGGEYTANYDAIDLGRTDLPVSRVIYDFPDVEIDVNPTRNAVYRGKVDVSGTKMHFGILTLRKTTSPHTYTPLAESDFAPHAGADLQGYWKGEILAPGKYPDGLGALQLANVNGKPNDGSVFLPINLKIAGEPDGTLRAEVDSPMQGAYGQPASVTVRDGTIKLALNSNAGMFRGALDSSGQELTGSWIQGGKSFTATFKRANYLAELERLEEEDFSYTSPSDLQGHWKGTWDWVIGTTTIKMRFELDIAKMPDGTYSATLASPDQFGNDKPMPASSFEYSPPNVHGEWKWAGGVYDGQLKDGKIVGTWQEGGGGFSLVFERKAE